MNKPLIVTFVGIPGSGKTTFAKQLAERLGCTVLNSDGIRMSMWKTLDAIHATHSDPEARAHANQLTFGAMNYAAKQILSAGQSVVYDCNANRLTERKEKHDIARETNAISVVVRIKVPYETSLSRIQYRDEAHDQRRISEAKANAVLERFMSEIEEPTNDEAVVVTISGEDSFEDQYSVFDAKLQADS